MKHVLLVVGVTIVVVLGVIAAAVFKEDQVDTFVAPTNAPVKASATIVVDAPEPTPSPTPVVTPAPTPLPSGVTPGPVTPPPPTPTPVPLRDAGTVDCSKEPQFCSPKHNAEVKDRELAEPLSREPKKAGEDALSITMSSQIRRPDRLPAATGDEVGSVRVEVTIENTTHSSYYFAERKVLLVIYRDGQVLQELKTTGEGFQLTPTGRAVATFEWPVADDGAYSWEAKTWYYQ